MLSLQIVRLFRHPVLLIVENVCVLTFVDCWSSNGLEGLEMLVHSNSLPKVVFDLQPIFSTSKRSINLGENFIAISQICGAKILV